MSNGIVIFDESGNIRLDLSSALVHYLGTVSKAYSQMGLNVTRIDSTQCPTPYSGRVLCVISTNNNATLGGTPARTVVLTRLLPIGSNTLDLLIPNYQQGYGETSGTLTIHFMGL
jgi:hypothetical protein